MALKLVKPKCETCGAVHPIRVDTDAIDPGKIRIESCILCPLELRRQKFRAIAEHGMKPREVKVKEIPGMNVLAEIKPVKSKHYG